MHTRRHPQTAHPVTTPDAETRALQDDLLRLGEAVIALYLQAINGVICDPTEEPGRLNCAACRRAWEQATDVLEKHDAKWGDMYRAGGPFQPPWSRA